jgi:hypothetical protein
VKSIEIIEYDPECPFTYNNFLYDITLETQGHSVPSHQQTRQAGTTELPKGVSRLIGRLANRAADGLQHENRMENEVAAMSLARQALANSQYAGLVPAVYDWGSAKDGQQGWMLVEHKTGVQLDSLLPGTAAQKRQDVISQMAEVFALLQQFQLPAAMTSFGGLSFDANGKIMSGPMTTFDIPPQARYKAFLAAKLDSQLRTALEYGLFDGWQVDGIDKRVRAVTATVAEDKDTIRKTFVHSDLSIVYC